MTDIAIQQMIGPFHVERPILVREDEDPAYLCWDASHQKQIVIQTILANPETYPLILSHFQQEAVLSARLKHPSIVKVIGVGSDEKLGPFLITEYVPGPSVRWLLDNKKISIQTGLRILIQVSHALIEAEAMGIHHQTLRPEFLLVNFQGLVKALMLGKARIAQAEVASGCFAFARTAFEILIGSNPFPDIKSHETPRKAPSIPDRMDHQLAMVFERALSPDPTKRFDSLSHFMDVLIADAPLTEEQRIQLLELMDRTEPDTADPLIAALAKDRDPRFATGEVPQSLIVEAISREIPVHPKTESSDQHKTQSKSYRTAEVAVLPQEDLNLSDLASQSLATPDLPKALRPESSRTGLWVGAAAFVALLTVGAWLFMPKPHAVQIHSSPEGAQVELDGKVLGVTPMSISAPAKGGALRLTKEGHQSLDLSLKPEDRSLQLRLEEMPKQELPKLEARPVAETTPSAAPIEEEKTPALKSTPVAKPKANKLAVPKAPAPKPASKGKEKFDLFKQLEKQGG
jgi:serine/threonine protein kinase